MSSLPKRQSHLPSELTNLNQPSVFLPTQGPRGQKGGEELSTLEFKQLGPPLLRPSSTWLFPCVLQAWRGCESSHGRQAERHHTKISSRHLRKHVQAVGHM